MKIVIECELDVADPDNTRRLLAAQVSQIDGVLHVFENSSSGYRPVGWKRETRDQEDRVIGRAEIRES